MAAPGSVGHGGSPHAAMQATSKNLRVPVIFCLTSFRRLGYIINMSAKKGGSVKTKNLALFAEPDLHEAVRLAAFKAHCSMSEIVRRAVVAYLAPKPGKRRGA